jgi:hypothetical protein
MGRKKYIALLLVLVAAFSMQIPVLGAESQATAYVPIQPFWLNVSRANAHLTFSGNTAHCTVNIMGLSGTTSISATVRLERVVGNSITTVATWTDSSSNSWLSISESATVTSNGTYRLRVNATVIRNGVSEDISFTS